MGKCNRGRGKKRPTPYDGGVCSNNTQANDSPADTDPEEVDKCEQCNKQVDQLLQCELYDVWFCCACQSVPANMMIALSSYKSLHWFCKTCELGVVSKLSNSNATSALLTPELSEQINQKIDESMAKALQQLSSIVSEGTAKIKSAMDAL